MGIDRRLFLKQIGAAGVAFSTGSVDGAAGIPASAGGGRKPNIVVILSDDVGYGDLSCYGATSVRTPRLDELARSGRRFTDAHSDAATCTPSRYALLTGSYGWRHDGVAILPGDADLLIGERQGTVASILKSAGYHTGLVGKWHIGLGHGEIDWNGEIKPGPLEVGFDEAFYFAATADRVPTVFIRNHHVENLDPADPIKVSYKQKIGSEPTGLENPEELRVMNMPGGHDGTIVDGIGRIGFMTGGKSARWKDEEIAPTFTREAEAFIERNQHKPFFLLFTPSDIHVPRAPAPMFANRQSCGVRCDVIAQLDWSVGRIMEKLKALNLEKDTLVLFTSDNGPVVNDGYKDGSLEKIGTHKPAGPFRGGKYQIFEGGTRVPFITRWPGHVKPGVSDALVSQLDLAASFASLARTNVPIGQAEDSVNVLTTLLGTSQSGRTSLVEEAQVLAIRSGQWKLIDRSQRPGEHPRPMPKRFIRQDAESIPIADLELYDLKSDPHETNNVASQHKDVVDRLRSELARLRSTRHS